MIRTGEQNEDSIRAVDQGRNHDLYQGRAAV